MPSNPTLPDDVLNEAAEAGIEHIRSLDTFDAPWLDAGDIRDVGIDGRLNLLDAVSAIAPLIVEWAQRDALLRAADELRLDRQEGSTFTKGLPLATAEWASKHAEKWLRTRAAQSPTTDETTEGER